MLLQENNQLRQYDELREEKLGERKSPIKGVYKISTRYFNGSYFYYAFLPEFEKHSSVRC